MVDPAMSGITRNLVCLSTRMSRLVSAKRSSRRNLTARQRLGEDEELDIAGPSGLSQPPAPGDSDWEDELDDSDDDPDYVVRPHDHDVSDSDEEAVHLDYVRTLDSSIDSVDSVDSDEPISERIYRKAQDNAPGTDDFSWSNCPAFVQRRGFTGVYSLIFIIFIL